LEGDGPSAGPLDLVDGFVGSRSVGVVIDRDGIAILGQASGDGAADSAGGTGDEGSGGGWCGHGRSDYARREVFL